MDPGGRTSTDPRPGGAVAPRRPRRVQSGRGSASRAGQQSRAPWPGVVETGSRGRRGTGVVGVVDTRWEAPGFRVVDARRVATTDPRAGRPGSGFPATGGDGRGGTHVPGRQRSWRRTRGAARAVPALRAQFPMLVDADRVHRVAEVLRKRGTSPARSCCGRRPVPVARRRCRAGACPWRLAGRHPRPHWPIASRNGASDDSLRSSATNRPLTRGEAPQR
jgi:hypothetical protein